MDDKVLELVELIDSCMQPPVTYSSEDDSVGYNTCCNTVAYVGHKDDCWFVRVKALAKEIKDAAGKGRP